MKVIILLAVCALAALAAADPAPEGAVGKGEREGRYLIVANQGLYDQVYKKYVVVGTPVYADYVKSYRSYYYTQPSYRYKTVKTVPKSYYYLY